MSVIVVKKSQARRLKNQEFFVVSIIGRGVNAKSYSMDACFLIIFVLNGYFFSFLQRNPVIHLKQQRCTSIF